MTNYEIITDGALNVNPSFVNPSDFRMIPMVVSMDDEDFLIGEDTPSEVISAFYRDIRDSVATTSQISLSIYEAYFQKFLNEGRDVLYLSLSGGISATYTQALLAKKVCSISTRTGPSLASTQKTAGPPALSRQARRIQSGAGPFHSRKRTRPFELFGACGLYRTDYQFGSPAAKRSRIGRNGPLGSALNIKPILLMNDDGDLIVSDKARGTKQAAKRLVQTLQGSMDPDETTVLLSHGDDEKLALTVKETILEKTPATDVYVDVLTPVVSAHIGQGALGMSFIQKIAH